ncbi:MAG: EamA family transporter [Hyphomicrobiales bacterium]|nr:EamA family transporter [Hyphomicrobiales bacterium]MBV8769160.1 EamA family transporter [Hyphomicrobiales bacterium]MBV9052184.1 EamA family transporter [Hyphomicrobiales bacterium]MBV9590123.1 EamA family transporter [Hyphomicrobiales bacterium]MBV9974671.1 EamA family transporter [Hyphomicrobiales bacterium]
MKRPFSSISLRMVLFWSVFLTLDTATQIAFKKASEHVESISFGWLFLTTALGTPAFWVAILCYIATFVVWMAVLTRMDLSRAFPLTALTYVTVPALAFLFFGEHLPIIRIVGIAVIIAGVIMIGWEE